MLKSNQLWLALLTTPFMLLAPTTIQASPAMVQEEETTVAEFKEYLSEKIASLTEDQILSLIHI